jgi:hypothetical protein
MVSLAKLLLDNRMAPFNPALPGNGIAVAVLLYVIFTLRCC